jgi:uncharacterized metal-binding protein YceD (DUF177 family)
MKERQSYNIPFIGLKLGFHDFTFEIGDTFFDEVDYSIIQQGKVNAQLKLEKKETMLIADFSISGEVFTTCDRCNDPLEVPVKGQFKVIFSFGTQASDDENLHVLHPDAYELELFDIIYELITVSLPSRKIHKSGECNEEMIQLISKYSVIAEESEEEDWDDEDWDDDEDWYDDDDLNEDDEDPEDDGPIDPRWKDLAKLK